LYRREFLDDVCQIRRAGRRPGRACRHRRLHPHPRSQRLCRRRNAGRVRAAGVDNRDSVAKTLGRPTFVGQFDQNEWFYVSRSTAQLAFNEPRPTAQTVLRVRFDEAGNVASVDRSGLEKIASISPEGDKTPTLGRERGFFQELFGNIGAVRAPGAPGQGQPQ
jgi:hypothetical protein